MMFREKSVAKAAKKSYGRYKNFSEIAEKVPKRSAAPP